MFVIIQYYDYRKEVSIRVRGYSESLEKAKEATRKIIKNAGRKDKEMFIDEEKMSESEYVSLDDCDLGKVICELKGYEIEKTTEEERKSWVESVKEELKVRNEEENFDIKFIAEIMFNCSKEDLTKLSEHFNLNEVIHDNPARQLELLDFMNLNNLGYDDNRSDKRQRSDGYIYAIVEALCVDNL